MIFRERLLGQAPKSLPRNETLSDNEESSDVERSSNDTETLKSEDTGPSKSENIETLEGEKASDDKE